MASLRVLRSQDSPGFTASRSSVLRSVLLVSVEYLAGLGLGDGVPALPGDAEDDGGDYEPDDRVGQVEAEGNDCGAREDSEADEAVDAGMVSVGDEGGTVQPTSGAQATLGGDLVADEADDAGGGQEP